MRRAFTREQRLLVVNGMLSFVLLLVVLQLWLLTATMNAYLGGDEAVIWPAAMASLVCFGLGAGLLQYLYALERPVDYVATEGNTLQLTMATGTFAVCFAVFGSASAMMPQIKERLELSAVQVSIALALPVLLGSLGRIPLGMLSDRYAPRAVSIGVLICTVLAGTMIGFVDNYPLLLACGFFLGIGLASFSAAAPLASGWYPARSQGAAMGVYGMGNIGQSMASLGAPMVSFAMGASLGASMGYRWGFWFFALLAFFWLLAFLTLARDPRKPLGAPTKRPQLLPLLREPKVWMLSFYYFLTFGGLVAMAVYLPTLLTDPGLFGLERLDAGFRAAGFAALATVLRPIGGSLADRVGGQKVLLGVFPATAFFALVMALAVSASSMFLFTVGALGMAAAIGLGNGAVFKLVPQYFPHAVGSVTGLVGAAGGLGGFFPPLVLGTIRQATGTYTLGFVLLSLFSGACLVVCLRTSPRRAVQIAAA